MVDGANSSKKQHKFGNNKSFHDQNQTKIVLRHLPPTLTSEQFLEIVSPLPEHDYYRFCKPDPSLGQQHSFCRAYLNIRDCQDLIVFTEKFQGYIFLDKNGHEYPCLVEYAPNQMKPKSDQQNRKDPKMNSIEQDPEYQAFVANMNAPLTGSEVLPNPETMLEEIEKKQREIHDSKSKFGVSSTPLLEFLKRKREEKKQRKQSNKQQLRNNEDSRPSTGRVHQDDDYYSSSRYSTGERSNRNNGRSFEKGDFRSSKNKEQKRSTNSEQNSSKSSKQQNSKFKQSTQQISTLNPKDSKQNQPSKPTNDDQTKILSNFESQNKRENNSNEIGNVKNDPNPNEDRSNSSTKFSSANSKVVKNRPSIQIYNPGERIRLRREQNQPN